MLKIPDPRDNIWQFLGTVSGGILAIVAIVLSVWFFVIDRQNKALSYEILSTSAVLVNPDAVGKLEILYNGIPIPDARLTIIRISNSGNVPIPSQDFEEPIVIEASSGRILSVDVIETKPENLLPREWEPTIGTQGQSIDIPPLLLNEGDTFTIQLLSDNEIGETDVDARIAGIKEATAYVGTSVFPFILLSVLAGFFPPVYLLVVEYRRSRESGKPMALKEIFVALVTGIVLMATLFVTFNDILHAL